MLRFSKIFVALSLMLCIQLSAQSLAWVFYHNPAYPGKCYINADLILSAGELANSPEGCAEFLCHGGDSGKAAMFGCSPYAPPPNCKFGDSADPSSKFPICCVLNVTCDDAKSLSYALEHQKSLRAGFEKIKDV